MSSSSRSLVFFCVTQFFVVFSRHFLCFAHALHAVEDADSARDNLTEEHEGPSRPVVREQEIVFRGKVSGTGVGVLTAREDWTLADLQSRLDLHEFERPSSEETADATAFFRLWALDYPLNTVAPETTLAELVEGQVSAFGIRQTGTGSMEFQVIAKPEDPLFAEFFEVVDHHLRLAPSENYEVINPDRAVRDVIDGLSGAWKLLVEQQKDRRRLISLSPHSPKNSGISHFSGFCNEKDAMRLTQTRPSGSRKSTRKTLLREQRHEQLATAVNDLP